MPIITAQILYCRCGTFVLVTFEGNPMPWEFSVRAAAIRTPMRERYTLARAVEYVGSKLEPLPAAAAA